MSLLAIIFHSIINDNYVYITPSIIVTELVNFMFHKRLILNVKDDFNGLAAMANNVI
jgi:hypothetical protein